MLKGRNPDVIAQFRISISDFSRVIPICFDRVDLMHAGLAAEGEKREGERRGPGDEDGKRYADLIFSVAMVVHVRGETLCLFQSDQGNFFVPEAAFTLYLRVLVSSSLTGNCNLRFLPSSAMPSSFCDENQGTIGLTFAWVLLSIGILIVSLRIYVRSVVNRKIGWDDYTAVASLVSISSCLRSAFTFVVV